MNLYNIEVHPADGGVLLNPQFPIFHFQNEISEKIQWKNKSGAARVRPKLRREEDGGPAASWEGGTTDRNRSLSHWDPGRKGWSSACSASALASTLPFVTFTRPSDEHGAEDAPEVRSKRALVNS